jgi:hypothetical protein
MSSLTIFGVSYQTTVDLIATVVRISNITYMVRSCEDKFSVKCRSFLVSATCPTPLGVRIPVAVHVGSRFSGALAGTSLSTALYLMFFQVQDVAQISAADIFI